MGSIIIAAILSLKVSKAFSISSIDLDSSDSISLEMFPSKSNIMVGLWNLGQLNFGKRAVLTGSVLVRLNV